MATIYICGIDPEQNENQGYLNPAKIIKKLKILKCPIVNPENISFPSTNWSDLLTKRLELLKRSQIVYVLPNWKDNIMSRIELTVAMDMNLETVFHPVSNKEIKKLITTLDD
ncbi:MAG: hypothetical protein N4A74_02765 [Carboxylicivirga sp.]|jgi:hypothetical protein|nr:hypothetical protein [Carboxylicivirga sp.]